MSLTLTFSTFLFIYFLVKATNQREVQRIPKFSITTFSKGSVDTSKSLSSQEPTAMPTSTKELTGSIQTAWKGDSVGITAKIFFRDFGYDTFNSTKILTIKFPFKIEGDFYEDKDLVYSNQAAPELRIREDDIELKIIDHKIHVFEASLLKNDYNLRSLRTNIKVVIVQGKRSETHYPEAKHFELFYEDESQIYHILIDQTMYQNKRVSGLLANGIALAGFFLAGTTAFFIIFHELKRPRDQILMVHFGMLSTNAMFIFTGFSLIPLIKEPEGFIYLAGVMFVIFLLKAVETLNLVFDKSIPTKSSLFWLWIALVVFVNLAWFVLLFIDIRQSFRGYLVYSLMVLVDLVFTDLSNVKDLKMWKYWLVVMLPGLANQIICYSFYLIVFWGVHREIPPILRHYALPNLFVFIFSIVLFYLKLRVKKGLVRLAPSKNQVRPVLPGSVSLRDRIPLSSNRSVNKQDSESAREVRRNIQIRDAPPVTEYKAAFASKKDFEEETDIQVLDLVEEIKIEAPKIGSFSGNSNNIDIE